MRTLRVVAPILIALWVGACCWAAPPGKPTVVVCPEVAQGPRLDGKLDPAEWAAAGLLSDFVTVGTGILPRLPTRVYVLHTSRALFIGAQMYDDKPSELVANVTQRDGPVYEDDCLEIYIDTGGSNEEFAHLVVNSLGTKFDEYGRDVQENFDWNAVAAVNDTGWSVEIELPFENEVPPLEGEVWRLGVCRNAARTGELSGWGRHERAFLEPRAFGEMIFKAPMLTAQVDDWGDQVLGENVALVTLHNRAPVPQTAKANVVVSGADRRSHYFGSVKKDLPARGSVQIYVPYRIRRCGPVTLTLSLTDQRGVVAWRTAPVQVDLPEVSIHLDRSLRAIVEAWKAWARLASPAEREAHREELETLQKEWSYLDNQMAAAMGVPTARLSAIGMEAQRLTARAEAIREAIENASTGRGP